MILFFFQNIRLKTMHQGCAEKLKTAGGFYKTNAFMKAYKAIKNVGTH